MMWGPDEQQQVVAVPVAAVHFQGCSVGQKVWSDVGSAPNEGPCWGLKLDLGLVDRGLHSIVDALQLQPSLLRGAGAVVPGQPEGCVPQHGVQLRPAVEDVWDAVIVGPYVGVRKHLRQEAIAAAL